MNQNPPTDEQLNQIEARAQAASKGPWTLAYEYCDCSENCGHGLYVSRINTGAGPATELGDLPRSEWELMVHAREDVDVLLAEVRRLRDELATARVQAIRDLADKADPQRPEISFFGDHGHEVGAWMRKQAEYEERRAATPASAVAVSGGEQ